MALQDWNQDGKNDDMDYFIERQVIKNAQKGLHNMSTSNNGTGWSIFMAIIAFAGGGILQGLLYSMIGIEMNDVPWLIVLILEFVFGYGIAAFLCVVFDE